MSCPLYNAKDAASFYSGRCNTGNNPDLAFTSVGPNNRLPDRRVLVSQEVSDLWRATTPDPVNISDTFSQREFTAALQHLKTGKAPGLDSICPELIIHAGAAL